MDPRGKFQIDMRAFDLTTQSFFLRVCSTKSIQVESKSMPSLSVAFVSSTYINYWLLRLAKMVAEFVCVYHFRHWRKGNYCALCNGCFATVEEAGPLVGCRQCSKRAHQGRKLVIFK